MTAKELAALLNGRQYGKEITKDEEAAAKEAGLVVVFGQSDDCMEFRGAINGEKYCFDGGMVYINEKGLFESPDCAEEYGHCEYVRAELDKCTTITALWSEDEDDFPWSYSTEIPHETFEIFDDGEKYCRGIVFDMVDLSEFLPEEMEDYSRGLRALVNQSDWEPGEKEMTLRFIDALEKGEIHGNK